MLILNTFKSDPRGLACDRSALSPVERKRHFEEVTPTLRKLVRRYRPVLLEVRRLGDAEVEAELVEDGVALRRARRQDEGHSLAGRSSRMM